MAANPRQAHATPGIWSSSTLPVLLIVAAVAVGIAALLPLVQSSGATSTAGHIRQLQQEREDWQARLHEQEVKVARLGSLERIDQEARIRLKMGPPTIVHYFSVDAPAPAPHRLPARFLPPQDAPVEPGDTLWKDIADWLPLP